MSEDPTLESKETQSIFVEDLAARVAELEKSIVTLADVLETHIKADKVEQVLCDLEKRMNLHKENA